QEISVSNYAKSVTHITKEQAAERLKEDLGEDFISFLGYNPLLSSLDVKLNADFANADTLTGIEKSLLQKPYVKEVVYHKDMIKQVNQNAKVVSLYLLIFSGLLL